jgi:hypothetical protein
MLIVKSDKLIYLEGAYLDSANGNLQINAADIKTKTLTDKATSWLAGAGLDAGNSAFGAGVNVKGGSSDKYRNIYAAIGKGVIILGDKEIDEALSEILGISRDTNLAEFEGEEYKLDVTYRELNKEQVANAWSGGPKGVGGRVADGVTQAVGIDNLQLNKLIQEVLYNNPIKQDEARLYTDNNNQEIVVVKESQELDVLLKEILGSNVKTLPVNKKITTVKVKTSGAEKLIVSENDSEIVIDSLTKQETAYAKLLREDPLNGQVEQPWNIEDLVGGAKLAKIVFKEGGKVIY